MSINTVIKNNAMPIAAAMMGRNFGVNVIMGQFQTAATDLKTIYLPEFDHTDAQQVAIAWGFIVHECGHIRCHSDLEKFQAVPSKKERYLINLLDDGRIERGISRIYPGAKQYLHDLTGALIDKNMLTAATKEDGPGLVLTKYMLHHISYVLLGYSKAKTVYDATLLQVNTFARVSFITRINAILMEAVLAKDFDQIMVLAKEVIALMEEEAEQEQDSDPQDSSSPESQEGEKGESTQESSADSAPDGEHGDQVPDESAIAQALASLEHDLSSLKDKGDLAKPLITSVGHSQSTLAPVHEDNLQGGKGGQRYHAVRRYASTLRNHIEGLLQADTMMEVGYAKKGRRIEPRRICRIRQGDLRVFRTQHLQEGPDTALYIALDMSASMSGNQHDALRATLALTLAISDLPGVDVKVCTFQSAGDAAVRCLKEFGQDIKDISSGFDDVYAAGGTPMSSVISNATLNLISRPEPRKLIWMITDGHDGGASDELFDNLLNYGIEATGIFIGSPGDEVNDDTIKEVMNRKFKRQWAKVQTMAQLKSALAKLAKTGLLHKK